MFDDNWLLYIFIIMLLFGRDGEIEGTELAVLLATTLAVLVCDDSGCGIAAARKQTAATVVVAYEYGKRCGKKNGKFGAFYFAVASEKKHNNENI